MMTKAELAMPGSAKQLLDVRQQGPDGPVEVSCATDNLGPRLSALISATGTSPHLFLVLTERTMLLRCSLSMTKSGLAFPLHPQPNW